MKYYKVEGHTNLVRDPSTMAIINTNTSEYESYIRSKNKLSEESKKIENLENEITSIKDDLSEIKDLLRNLSK